MDDYDKAMKQDETILTKAELKEAWDMMQNELRAHRARMRLLQKEYEKKHAAYLATLPWNKETI